MRSLGVKNGKKKYVLSFWQWNPAFYSKIDRVFLILEGVIFQDKCDSKCDSYPEAILFDEKKMISNAKNIHW